MIFALRTLKSAPLYMRHKTREGAPVGYIQRFLFDVGTAKLQRVVFRSGFLRCTLQAVDAGLLEIVRGRVYVSSYTAVTSLRSLSPSTKNNCQELLSLRVYTRSGVFVGRIVDLYLEESSLQMVQLEVVQRMLFLPLVRLLITRQDVLDILPDKVIVRDAVLEEEDLVSLFLSKGRLKRIIRAYSTYSVQEK